METGSESSHHCPISWYSTLISEPSNKKAPREVCPSDSLSFARSDQGKGKMGSLTFSAELEFRCRRVLVHVMYRLTCTRERALAKLGEHENQSPISTPT